MKKTIFIGANDLIVGGVQRLIIDQLRAFDQNEFDVHLAVLMDFKDKGTFYELVPEGVTVHRVGFSGLADIGAWMRLMKLLSKVRPQVVKTATFFSNFVFLILRPFFGYRVIAAEHNTLNIKPLWQRLADKALLPTADTVIGDSTSVVEFVAKAEGINPKHFTVLYNGVDVDAVERAQIEYGPARTSIRAEYSIPPEATVIFTAGRLVHQKNHHLMIEGFAEFVKKGRDAYLMIAGGGKYEQELKELAGKLGVIDRVRLLGEQMNVHRFYAIADIFLLTSRHEGFCIAAMEGLAFGQPLISTRVAGVSEYLKDGVNGFFIEPNADDIAEKLERAITLTDTERASFREEGRKTARAYDIKRYQDNFMALVRKSLG